LANEYDLGDTIRLTGTFASTAGVPANPTAVTFWVKAPSSTVAVAETSTSWSNPSVGSFTFDVHPSSTGVWAYRVFSTGNIIAAEEGQFMIRTPLVPSTGT
jgi:hypothetical protein